MPEDNKDRETYPYDELSSSIVAVKTISVDIVGNSRRNIKRIDYTHTHIHICVFNNKFM